MELGTAGEATVKILYLSCHEVLEFDEVTMLTRLGADVFPAGAYLDPSRPHGESLRLPIAECRTNEDDLAAYRALVGSSGDHGRCLTAPFLRRFDAVIVMHHPHWADACIQADSPTPIIWRTIGQSNPAIERRMRTLRRAGLKVVRYSPKEQRLDDYCGHDAVIRFGKPLDDFEGWKGSIRRVVAFSNRMRQRGPYCGYETFRRIVEPFACDLYGTGNDDVPDIARGPVAYQDQLRVLSRYRALVYTGTYPASYTLAFIEAWLAGIPIVAIGPGLWGQGVGPGHLYEVPDLITHGVTGFVSDSIPELQSAVRNLMDDDRLAGEVSSRGREAANRLFDVSIVRRAWRDFLNSL